MDADWCSTSYLHRCLVVYNSTHVFLFDRIKNSSEDIDMEWFVTVLELIGTLSFAVSGAMTALKKHMDVLGVCVLGLVTACGGGILRDVLMGNLPPVMFRDPIYALAAVVCSLIVFLPFARRKLLKEDRLYEILMLWSDALGLGIFTAVGITTAMHAGYSSRFFAAFLGVITGVGGGVLRDVLAGQPPYIFVKHFYACAAMLGAIACVLLWPLAGERGSIFACCGTILILRILAARYHWSLPKAND